MPRYRKDCRYFLMSRNFNFVFELLLQRRFIQGYYFKLLTTLIFIEFITITLNIINNNCITLPEIRRKIKYRANNKIFSPSETHSSSFKRGVE